MADSKLSALPSGVAITDADLWYSDQAATSVKQPSTALATYLQSKGFVIGTTPIIGGTDTRVLFDKAGVIGEDANFTWDYIDNILKLGSATKLAWGTSTQLADGTNGDLVIQNSAGNNSITLSIDGATDVLALRRSTNPQNFRIYNTFTNASNYERGVFDWTTTANVLTFGTAAAGSGTVRNFQFVAGGPTVGDFGITNSAKWTFNHIISPIIESGGFFYTSVTGGPGYVMNSVGINFGNMADVDGHTWQLGYSPNNNTNGTAVITWTDNGPITISPTNGFLEQRNSTNPQTFRLYNTFTDASNYERGVFDWTTAGNVLTIGTQKGGSGSSRDVSFTVGGVEWARMSTVAAGVTAFGTSTSGAISFTNANVPIIQALDLDTRKGACLGLASFNTANDQPYAEMAFSRGTTIGAQTIVQSGDWLGLFAFSGSDGTAFKYGAYFQVEVDGAPGAGSMPGKFTIWTTPSGTTSPVRRLAVDNQGSVIASNAAVATNATDGFFYAGAGAGAPTGVPTAHTGTVPMYIDTTNSQLWLYLGGAWKQPKTPAGAATVTWQ